MAAGPPIVAESTFRWRVQEEVFNESLQVLMDPTLGPRTFGVLNLPAFLDAAAAAVRRPSMEADGSSASAGGLVLEPEGPDWPQTAQMDSGTF